MRGRRADVDLAAYVPGWTPWLADRVKPSTADSYLAHVRTLMPAEAPFYRSQFTAPAVAQWLATRPSLSGSTKRHYLAGLQRFAAYLVEIGMLPTNPLRDVTAPPANPPRCVFLELPDVRRVVEGALLPFRAIYALAYGAGLEISAILALVDADVNAPGREVRARGTKAWTRDRIARVADWAWPHVQAHLDTLLPGERLFRGISRRAAGDVHRERLKALGLPHHHLHDSRHHWAVRMVRAGMPLELVARQLGHRDVVMVARVYGRF
ncbi:MAG TPA: tyrosine-type recombinase/integrase, partial [Gemmatimonadales bacterium]|nr:tyrosine-type recombinase/integrase [Gemmatimonadales bacterium]